MNEITAHAETKYKLCGLTSEDMELIRIGLDSIIGIEHHRADKIQSIITAIKKILPEVDL